jgi:hypothetical protein
MRTEPDADQNMLDEIQSNITDGISLPFLRLPSPIHHSNTSTVFENAAAIRERLTEYAAFGAVVRLPPDFSPTHGVQPLHAVVKPLKKVRVVIDLSRNLNGFLELTPFHYSGVEDAVAASKPGCWYAKIDLSNCFLSFPLHPAVRPYFTFSFDDSYWQFTAMPFGLATAPLTCTRLLSVLEFALRREIGPLLHDLVRYLDDFLFVCGSAAASRATLDQACSIFASFGLIVNPAKTEGPSQRLQFLGITIDSVAMTLSCTQERIGELRQILTSTCNQRLIKKKHMESVIGKLSFAAQVLPGARPFMRRIQDSILRVSRKNAPIRVSAAVKEDISFWLEHLSDWNGTARWRAARSSAVRFASDASLNGFGFYLENVPRHIDTSSWPAHLRVGNGFSGLYAPAHAHLHSSHRLIGWCEMLAVYAAAVTYFPYLPHQ